MSNPAREMREREYHLAQTEVTKFMSDLARKYQMLRREDLALLFLHQGTAFVESLVNDPNPAPERRGPAWPEMPAGDWEGGEAPDGVPVVWLNVESSKLSALAYGGNEDGGPPILYARFKGSAEVYRYLDVGADIWHKLMRAAAGKLGDWTVGRFFSQYVEPAHYCELWDGLRWREPKRGQRPGVRRP